MLCLPLDLGRDFAGWGVGKLTDAVFVDCLSGGEGKGGLLEVVDIGLLLGLDNHDSELLLERCPAFSVEGSVTQCLESWFDVFNGHDRVIASAVICLGSGFEHDRKPA